MYRKTNRLELILDKKELLPLAVFCMEEWGLWLLVWDEYKFDVSLEEAIWKLAGSTNPDKEQRLFYEDENGVDESYQISATKVFYKGNEMVNSDPNSFRHLGKKYYRDDAKIYSRGEVIANADLETFNAIHSYARDKDHVFVEGKAIVGADPTSYGIPDSTGEVQQFIYYYLTDGDKIYVKPSSRRRNESNILEAADIESFELLRPLNGFDKSFKMCWARDKNHVFNYNKIVENADPATIIVLNQYQAKDKEHYIMGSNVFKNDSTFIVYPNLMAKNKEAVYKKYGTILKEADPESFKYLNEYYQKDRYRVFHDGTKSFNADAATFKAVGEEGFGYDKDFAYYRHFPIEGADPATWEWVDDFYSKDDRHVFFGSKIVAGADAATFTVIEIKGLKIGVDKVGKYTRGRFIDEAKLEAHIKRYGRE